MSSCSASAKAALPSSKAAAPSSNAAMACATPSAEPYETPRVTPSPTLVARGRAPMRPELAATRMASSASNRFGMGRAWTPARGLYVTQITNQ